MPSDEYIIRVDVVAFFESGASSVSRNDFETICEARSWLKAGTPALVDLTESKFIHGFRTELYVCSKTKAVVE